MLKPKEGGRSVSISRFGHKLQEACLDEVVEPAEQLLGVYQARGWRAAKPKASVSTNRCYRDICCEPADDPSGTNACRRKLRLLLWEWGICTGQFVESIGGC